MLKAVLLYWHTVRHLKIRQLLGRFAVLVRRQFFPYRIKTCEPVAPRSVLPARRPLLWHDAWNTSEALADGRLAFLGQARDLGHPVAWTARHQSLLWRFWLHSFGYLHLLPSEQRIGLCREWMAVNPLGSQPGWHAYPLSRRVTNWCKTDLRDVEVSRSLYEQAEFLYRNLEWHLGGNHLVENARALVLAGRLFAEDRGAKKWFEKGISLLQRETPKQILPDGWHYERSTMYHALVLEAYLDVINVLPKGAEQASMFDGAARRMLDVLVSATRPDGQITLFNDATQEIAPPTTALVEYGRSLLCYEPKPRESFPNAGYYTYRDGSLFVFIDGGPIGPDELPAHAHADIFSYELSILGVPFVVDGGVYEYQEGQMRDHVRHTRAHNTVCVDGLSQAECWKSFRVARRYPPEEVCYQKVGGKRVFEGRFDGYARLIGDRIQHKRTVVIDPRKRCITVDDTVHGHGVHSVQSRLHLHPEVRAEVSSSSARAVRDGVDACVEAVCGTLHSEDGWYCPRMGTRIRDTCLVIQDRRDLPLTLRYQIHY